MLDDVRDAECTHVATYWLNLYVACIDENM